MHLLHSGHLNTARHILFVMILIRSLPCRINVRLYGLGSRCCMKPCTGAKMQLPLPRDLLIHYVRNYSN